MSNETNDILSEILKWQKLHGMSIVRNLMPELVDSEKKRAVYELTDGENTQGAISIKAGVATGTVSNWWTQWHSHGLLTKAGARYQKNISLQELSLTNDKK